MPTAHVSSGLAPVPDDLELLAAFATADGLITTTDLIAAGFAHSDLRQLQRHGAITTLVRGVQVLTATLAAAQRSGTDALHLLTIKACLLGYRDRMVASHDSAAMLHDLPLWGRGSGLVHLTRLGASHGRIPGPVFVHATPRDQPTTIVDSWPTVSVADAVVGVGLTGVAPHRARPMSSLIAADAALHRGLTSRDEVLEALERHRGCRAIAPVRAAMAHLDARHASPAETRAAGLFRTLGIHATPQVRHVVEGSQFDVDFELDAWMVIVEVDGAIKYGIDRATPTADDLRHDLMREKRREDLLRSLGYEFVRLTWSDLSKPALVASRLDRVIARATRKRP